MVINLPALNLEGFKKLAEGLNKIKALVLQICDFLDLTADICVKAAALIRDIVASLENANPPAE